jgi:hypothetical protein
METIEYKWKRTVHTKVFQVDQTKKRILVSLRPLHYELDGKLTEIDLRPKQTPDGWVVQTPSYTCEIIKFPFEIKVRGYSIRNLDSPDLQYADDSDGLRFPLADIDLYFRPDGIEVKGSGTWKVNGEVINGCNMRIDYSMPLQAKTYSDFLNITKTAVPGELVSYAHKKRKTRSKYPEDTDLLEVVFSHAETWLHNN